MKRLIALLVILVVSTAATSVFASGRPSWPAPWEPIEPKGEVSIMSGRPSWPAPWEPTDQ